MRNTDELSALRRMHWLTDQILAKDDPITPDLVIKFGKNPGVLIPDEAVGLFSLPTEEMHGIGNWIPDGVGGVIFSGFGRRVIEHKFICLNREYQIGPTTSIVPLGVYKGEFIRIEKDGLAEAQCHDSVLMYGDKIVFLTSGINHALLRRDGSVLIVCEKMFCSEYQTVNLDSCASTPCSTTTRRYKSLMESEAGAVYGVYADDYVLKFGRFEEDPIANIQDNVLHGVELRGNQFAEVTTARHKMERWVFKSGPHPTFEKVSSLFNHPTHGLCYMGHVGNHIVTMKVPK
jgi:hypothetical protein